MLCLDEPTSAQDAVSEAAIGEMLQEHARRPGQEKLIVIVTHSMSLAAMADQVLVIEPGAQ